MWCNYGNGKKLVEVIRKYCSFQGEKTHSRLAQKQLEFEPSQYPVLGMKSASIRIMYKTTTAKFRFNVSLHALDITVIYLMNTLHLLVVVFDPVFSSCKCIKVHPPRKRLAGVCCICSLFLSLHFLYIQPFLRLGILQDPGS